MLEVEPGTMEEGAEPHRVRNIVRAGQISAAVQAGTVHGGVHIHQPALPGTRTLVPQQEPAPPVRFFGRDTELAILDSAWTSRGDRFGLVLITGPGGVGKSALAAQWAAQAKDRFPGGRLHADLGAYDPAGPPQPGEILGGFLNALGIPPVEVPARVGEQAALFRSLTAGRQLLVVLDNAISAAQVRQLLPGGGGCMVVVTARLRLGGLVSDGARILALEPLPAPAATALLRASIGDHRVDDDTAAAAELVRQCGGLPIALAVTAARLVAHPRWPVRQVVAELAGEHDRLALMYTPDGQSVAVTFDLSYRTLTEPSARCYRALGIHPGRRPGAAVIATALAMPPGQAARGLQELVEANLADDAPDGRYQVHDLILLHAQQHAQADSDRELLAGRIAEWYLAGTRAADLWLTPYRWRPPDHFRHLSPATVTFADRDEALDWLERERTNLVAAVIATANPAPELAWRIADCMWPLFHFRRYHHDRLTVDQVAVDCARQLGNREFEARMLCRLAFAYFDLGRWSEADQLFQTSLDLCHDLADRPGVAAAIEGLGIVALARHRLSRAAELFHRQLAICLSLGEHRRVALATLNLGLVDNAADRPAQAVPRLARAIEMFASLGDLDPYNAARARLALGKAYTGTGNYAAAERELQQSLSEMHRLGSPRGQAQAHQALAVLAIVTGQHGDAQARLVQALVIFERLGDAADIRTHLRQALDNYERSGTPDPVDVRRLAGLIPPADPDPHPTA